MIQSIRFDGQIFETLTMSLEDIVPFDDVDNYEAFYHACADYLFARLTSPPDKTRRHAYDIVERYWLLDAPLVQQRVNATWERMWDRLAPTLMLVMQYITEMEEVLVDIRAETLWGAPDPPVVMSLHSLHLDEIEDPPPGQ